MTRPELLPSPPHRLVRLTVFKSAATGVRTAAREQCWQQAWIPSSEPDPLGGGAFAGGSLAALLSDDHMQQTMREDADVATFVVGTCAHLNGVATRAGFHRFRDQQRQRPVDLNQGNAVA